MFLSPPGRLTPAAGDNPPEALLEAMDNFTIQTALRGPRGVSQTLAKLLRHAKEEAVDLLPDQARAS
jgi:hypothetical protein